MGGIGAAAVFEEGEDGAEGGEAGGHAAEIDFGAGPEGDGGEVPGYVGGGGVELVAGYEEDDGDGDDAVLGFIVSFSFGFFDEVG